MTTQSARVGGVTIATAVGVRASETRLRATTPLLGMYPQRSREIQVGQRKSPNGWYAEKDHLGALTHRQGLLPTRRDERVSSEGGPAAT